jgi:hypothetical protein
MDANKLNGFLLGILASLVVGGGIFYWTTTQTDQGMVQVPQEQHDSEQQTPSTDSQPEDTQTITHKPWYFDQFTDEFRILSLYPQVMGIESDINEALSAYSERKVENFKTGIEDVTTDQAMPSTSNFTMTYEPVALNKDLASFVFTISRYQAGAAHPLTIKEGFTYDFEREIPMNLNDLMDEYDMTLEDIAQTSREKLAERYKENDMYDESMQDWINDGTQAKRENFDAFTYDGGTLTIYFQPYQVAPYAAGIQSVEIELSQ